MTLPKKVKIGPFWFSVEKTSLLEDKVGMMDYRKQKIFIFDDMNEDIMADTLLHEILHTIFYASGVNEDFDHDGQERIVNTFATPLLQIIRDNPELVEFLKGKDGS